MQRDQVLQGLKAEAIPTYVHQELPARAAYRKAQGTASGSIRRAADYLVGPALDEAERSGEELEIVWPLRPDNSNAAAGTTNGSKTNGDSDDMKVEGAEDEAAKESQLAEGGLVQDWLALEALLSVLKRTSEEDEITDLLLPASADT